MVLFVFFLKWAETAQTRCVFSVSISPTWRSSSSCISLPGCPRPRRAARSLWWRACSPGSPRTAWWPPVRTPSLVCSVNSSSRERCERDHGNIRCSLGEGSSRIFCMILVQMKKSIEAAPMKTFLSSNCNLSQIHLLQTSKSGQNKVITNIYSMSLWFIRAQWVHHSEFYFLCIEAIDCK